MTGSFEQQKENKWVDPVNFNFCCDSHSVDLCMCNGVWSAFDVHLKNREYSDLKASDSLAVSTCLLKVTSVIRLTFQKLTFPWNGSTVLL